MKRLSSLKLEGLKRPPILISLVVVIVMLAVWYLGWMSPESAKLTTINRQEQTLTTHMQILQDQLLTDKAHAVLLKRDLKDLAIFSAAVPPAAEAGPLTTMLYNLSKTTGVSIQSLTDDTTASPLKGQTVSSIPITITLKGSHGACLTFLADVYKLPRLITIGAVVPASAASGQAQTDVLANDDLPYTMSLTATAYFFAKA
jgi:Tfp pilus assembly protein PilO